MRKLIEMVGEIGIQAYSISAKEEISNGNTAKLPKELLNNESIKKTRSAAAARVDVSIL